MNIAKFAAKLRILALSLGVIAATAGLGATASHAQNSDEDRPNSQSKAKKAADTKPGEPLKIDPALQAKAMADAPTIIATAKIACEPVNAYPRGAHDYEKADKTKVKSTLYEIACKTGPGFIVIAASPTEVYIPFTCTRAWLQQQKDPKNIGCELPENQPHYKWLKPVIQPYLPGCEISEVRLVGSSTEAPFFDRYEVGCTNKVGGLIDYPQLTSDAPVGFRTCIGQEGTNVTCTLSTREQIIDSLKPLAATADSKCQVKDVRFVGVTTEGNGIYYEFGCTNQPGFIVRAKLSDNSFERIVQCSAAASLGGCKLTAAADVAAGATGDYTSILKKAGFTCTVADFNVIGTQENTKRDYVEFKCPEQAWGLIGFVPQVGSTASASLVDCFSAKTRTRQCSITNDDMLKAHLDKLIKIAEPKKGCDIKDVRYIGETDDNALLAEIACVNKRGYIIMLEKDRNTISATRPCHLAKTHKDVNQCTIAGNGTYAANDE